MKTFLARSRTQNAICSLVVQPTQETTRPSSWATLMQRYLSYSGWPSVAMAHFWSRWSLCSMSKPRCRSEMLRHSLRRKLHILSGWLLFLLCAFARVQKSKRPVEERSYSYTRLTQSRFSEMFLWLSRHWDLLRQATNTELECPSGSLHEPRYPNGPLHMTDRALTCSVSAMAKYLPCLGPVMHSSP